MGRRCYVLLRRHHDVPIRCRGDVPLRRCWMFHLRRTCDVAGTTDVIITSLRRLVAGSENESIFEKESHFKEL